MLLFKYPLCLSHSSFLFPCISTVFNSGQILRRVPLTNFYSSEMATSFFVNISSPSILAPKTNILPLHKLTHKPPLYSTRNLSDSSYGGFAITKSYQNAPSASVALENRVLPDGLQAESIPKHVSIIVEKEAPELTYGVGRPWLMEIASVCRELGIKVLSVYSSSSANNPKNEVGFTVNITKSDLEELSRNDIRVSVIGDRSTIPDSIVDLITELEEATKNHKSVHIIETVNYTGYFDIVQSCKALAEKVNNGVLQPEEINEHVFEQELVTKFSEFPNPDMMIRTSGKSNVGNFLLWQAAYAEICFVEKDAIEFNKKDFIEALKVYQKRNRRFGGSDKTTKRK